MKFVKPTYKILEQQLGLESIYRQIELAGRTCYKSEDKITEDSAKRFVERIIASKHYSVLEHGTVYLMFNCPDRVTKYQDNPWSKVNRKVFQDDDTPNIYATVRYYVTTNYRCIIENGWLDDLKYLCEPTEFHEKRITVKFTSNIHFYKDLTRHRKMSFSIESTRYCNYSKDKFEKELTFIIPEQCNLKEGYYGMEYSSSVPCNGGNPTFSEGYLYTDHIIKTNEEVKSLTPINDENTPFIRSLFEAEQSYLKLIEQGWQPQQAAEVLPQATKADIVMTGFISDWKHVFSLRTSVIAATGKPLPEISRLMDPLYKEFIERKYYKV